MYGIFYSSLENITLDYASSDNIWENNIFIVLEYYLLRFIIECNYNIIHTLVGPKKKRSIGKRLNIFKYIIMIVTSAMKRYTYYIMLYSNHINMFELKCSSS